MPRSLGNPSRSPLFYDNHPAAHAEVLIRVCTSSASLQNHRLVDLNCYIRSECSWQSGVANLLLPVTSTKVTSFGHHLSNGFKHLQVEKVTLGLGSAGLTGRGKYGVSIRHQKLPDLQGFASHENERVYEWGGKNGCFLAFSAVGCF